MQNINFNATLNCFMCKFCDTGTLGVPNCNIRIPLLIKYLIILYLSDFSIFHLGYFFAIINSTKDFNNELQNARFSHSWSVKILYMNIFRLLMRAADTFILENNEEICHFKKQILVNCFGNDMKML